MWFTARCPVRPEEQDWIDTSMRWLVDGFGEAVLRRPVVLPTEDFFPGSYSGGYDDVHAVLLRIASHMEVDPARVDLVLEPTDQEESALLASLPAYQRSWAGAAGDYVRRDGRGVITVRGDQAQDPMGLVATIAHELGHERLIGEGRHDPTAKDHEPLTDLLTVVFGLGIFAANAAFEYRGRDGGWQTSRLGYLTEPMYGYALGRYAFWRGEPAPDWARHLDVNPRTYQKQTLRYLSRRP
ncbi:MAG TPA: hypothetical protein VK453_06555 [Micromonosporaceae bacterium]|nr:hypothetical protein [Micromonosporaceae bacterium]